MQRYQQLLKTLAYALSASAPWLMVASALWFVDAPGQGFSGERMRFLQQAWHLACLAFVCVVVVLRVRPAVFVPIGLIAGVYGLRAAYVDVYAAMYAFMAWACIPAALVALWARARVDELPRPSVREASVKQSAEPERMQAQSGTAMSQLQAYRHAMLQGGVHWELSSNTNGARFAFVGEPDELRWALESHDWRWVDDHYEHVALRPYYGLFAPIGSLDELAVRGGPKVLQVRPVFFRFIDFDPSKVVIVGALVAVFGTLMGWDALSLFGMLLGFTPIWMMLATAIEPVARLIARRDREDVVGRRAEIWFLEAGTLELRLEGGLRSDECRLIAAELSKGDRSSIGPSRAAKRLA